MLSVLINSQKENTTGSINIFDINRYKGIKQRKITYSTHFRMVTLLLIFQNIKIYQYFKLGEKSAGPRDPNPPGPEGGLPIEPN